MMTHYDYVISDNVDGDIPSENINCELELRDAEKHEWLVYVSYVDRAGNSSEAKFLIIVEEGGTASNNGNTNNAGSGGYLGSNDEYRWYVAYDVHEIDNSGLEWTDDGEIEFIDGQ